MISMNNFYDSIDRVPTGYSNRIELFLLNENEYYIELNKVLKDKLIDLVS